MTPVYADSAVSASPSLPVPYDERRMQHALRLITTAGWQERLHPLALHLGERRLVRSPGKPGAFVAHLDLDLLQEALGRFLHQDAARGYLVIACAVEGSPPTAVGAEMGLDRAGVMRALHAGLHDLARMYEALAWRALGADDAAESRGRMQAATLREGRHHRRHH